MRRGTHSYASPRIVGPASRRRVALATLIATFIVATTFGIGFAFFTTTDSSNPATSVAQSLPQGATPTTANNASSVTVTFSTVNTTGTPATKVTSYNVLRYVSGTASSSAISGSCSVAGTVVTCSDTPGNGSWQYTDTPKLDNWVGIESAKSTVIAVGVPPSVSSINRNDPNPTNATSLHWTVTFTEPVVNVAASDFSLVTTGLTGSPAITGLSPSAGPASTYVVTAATSGVSGTGTIGLNLTSAGTIQNTFAQGLTGALPFTGQTYTFDTVAPVVTLTQVNGANAAFPFSTSQTVTSVGGACGTASGDSTTVTLTVAPSGSGTTTCTGGAWTFTLSPPVSSGTITATATQADAAGNVGSSGAKVITVDTTPPVIALTKVNGNAVAFPYFTSQTVTSVGGACGTASGDSGTVSVSITIATQTATVPCSSGAWNYPLTTSLSAAGTYTASATQSDAAGNVGSTGNKTIVIDKTAPAVTITDPVTATAYSIGNNGVNKAWDTNVCTVNTAPAICGTASDAGDGIASVQISLQDQTTGKYWDGTFTLGVANFTQATQTWVTVSGTTSWSQAWSNTTFNESPMTGSQSFPYSLQARATDAAGNTSTASVTFNVTK